MATPTVSFVDNSITASTQQAVSPIAPIQPSVITTTTTTTVAPLEAPHPATNEPLPVSNNVKNSTGPKYINILPSTSSSTLTAGAQEILNRVSSNASIGPGLPGWEAAREQVLRGMTTHQDIAPLLPDSAARPRGRGRGRPPKNATLARPIAPNTDATTPAATPDGVEIRRGRGRPRGSGNAKARGGLVGTPRGSVNGRGRGRGRGGRHSGKGRKRKRGSDDDDDDGDNDTSDDDSDHSNSYTPLPTQTKSGRSVNKPTQYNPAVESAPGTGTKRRRTGTRKGPEYTLCSKCQRGHSPPSNLIVYCDACNTPYHQWCHDPMISREVVEIAEKEWFCMYCQNAASARSVDVSESVSAETLSASEKEAYFSSLNRADLLALLIHASNVEPTLPIFPPKLFRQPLQPKPLSQASSLSTPADTPSKMINSQSSISFPSVSPSKPHSPLSSHAFPIPPHIPTTGPDNHPLISTITLNAAAAAREAASADPPATFPRPLHGPYKLPQTLAQALSQGQPLLPKQLPQSTFTDIAHSLAPASLYPNGHTNGVLSQNSHNSHDINGTQNHLVLVPASVPPALSNPPSATNATNPEATTKSIPLKPQPVPSAHEDPIDPMDTDAPIPYLIDSAYDVFSHLYNPNTQNPSGLQNGSANGTANGGANGSDAVVLVPTKEHANFLREREDRIAAGQKS